MHTISTSDYLEYANISGHSYCPFQDQYYCRLMCVELSASASYRPALIFSNHIIMSCFINMITQILGRITGRSLKLASGPNPLPSRWAFRVIAFRLAIGTSTDQTSHWVAVTVYLGTCYMTLLWMLHLGRCQRLCKSTLEESRWLTIHRRRWVHFVHLLSTIHLIIVRREIGNGCYAD